MSKSLTPVADALASLLAAVPSPPATRTVALADALGCVLALDEVADLDVPAYDNSAMDGYALATADLAQSTRLPVSQTIAAGHPGPALQPGTLARIFTGAPIPAGANAVVMQELTRSEGGEVAILEAPQPGQNIRRRGHDLARGGVVLAAGTRLQPQDLGLLASLGRSTVEVYRPLTVALLNTGDEVVAPGTALAAGQLYDSNSFTLAGLLQRLGLRVLKGGIVRDSAEATRLALQDAAARADCIITTGGVSVGDADHVRQAVEQLGTLALWKLAIKPGKPFSFGTVGACPCFGLPGNPVAVFVTFAVLVRPFLLKMQGASAYTAPCFPVAAGFSVEEAGSRQEYLRVRLRQTAGGQEAAPFADQGSSLLSSLSWAEGLAIVPAGATIAYGQTIHYLPFGGLL